MTANAAKLDIDYPARPEFKSVSSVGQASDRLVQADARF